jgi:hypothetical protein
VHFARGDLKYALVADSDALTQRPAQETRSHAVQRITTLLDVMPGQDV